MLLVNRESWKVHGRGILDGEPDGTLPGSDNPAGCQPGNSEGVLVLLLINNSLIQQMFVEFFARHQVLGIQQLTLQIKSLPGEGHTIQE